MLTAIFLLLTPTLHPWYLIWIIPFLIFIPNWSWLLFTLLIQASYFVMKEYAISSVWQESVWILLFQYIPFYFILIWEYIDTRKIKGWLSLDTWCSILDARNVHTWLLKIPFWILELRWLHKFGRATSERGLRYTKSHIPYPVSRIYSFKSSISW